LLFSRNDERDRRIGGGAPASTSVDRRGIEELAEHLSDARFRVADRMTVVANDDMTALRQSARDFFGA
jgi:hypothetical protein